MKIKSFIKTSSRGDLLAKRAPQELVKEIKKLTKNQIKSLLQGFLPLDFFILIQKENRGALEEAFKEVIEGLLKKDPFPGWLTELGMEPSDATAETIIALLNDDPKNPGALADIKESGSYSHSFQYSQKGNPKLRDQLRQSLAPLDSGVVVPHCPTCKKLGIEHPLWSMDLKSGKLEIISGLEDGQCTEYEVLAEGSREEIESLQENLNLLPVEARSRIEDGSRELKIIDNYLIARCTFKAILPRVQNFLYFRIAETMSKILNPERRSLGKMVSPKDLERARVLRGKEKIKTITPEERKELQKLESRIQEKSKEMVGPSVSLDSPIADDEGGARSRHEELAQEKDEDLVASEEGKLELKNFLGEKEFDFLEKIVVNFPLSSVVKKISDLMSMSGKDPKRKALESEIKLDFYKIAQKALEKKEGKKNQCNSCGEFLSDSAKICFHASEMQGLLYSGFASSENYQEFEAKIKRINSKALAHYNLSNLEPILKSAFKAGALVDDDLLEGLDLEGFGDEEPLEEKASKVSEEDLKKSLKKELTPEQQKHFEGTNITGNQLEIDEGEQEIILNLAKRLELTISKIFERELEDSLISFILGHGAI